MQHWDSSNKDAWRPRAGATTGRGAVVALWTILFAAVLHYVYMEQLAPNFASAGIRYRTPSVDHYAVSICACIAVAAALPRVCRQPSHVMLWVLFVVAGAPSMLVPQYADILEPYDATITGLVVGIALIATRVIGATLLPRHVVPLLRLPSRLFWIGVASISALIYAYLLTSGLSFRLVELADVYNVRADYVRDAAGIPFLGYLLGLQSNVINPLLIGFGVRSKSLAAFLAGLGGQLAIYAATGFRSVLLSIPAIVAVSILLYRRRFPSGSTFLLGGVAAMGIALGLDKIFGSFTWSSLFIRRFLVVPGILTAAYVLVFRDRPKTLFSDSLFPWIEFPYAISPANIVGTVYFGDPSTSANASVFAHGFLNAGYLGVILECLVLSLLLTLADDAARGLPLSISGLLFLMPAISLSNSSVFTVTLTHGLLAAIVIAACLPRDGTSGAGAGDGAYRRLEPARGDPIHPR